jgi:hypothetical protein
VRGIIIILARIHPNVLGFFSKYDEKKSSSKKVKIIKPDDKKTKIISEDNNITLSFFGCLETNVAIALGNDKFDIEIRKTIRGLTREKIPIASIPSSRFIRIFDSKEMNFARNPRNKILITYNV